MCTHIWKHEEKASVLKKQDVMKITMLWKLLGFFFFWHTAYLEWQILGWLSWPCVITTCILRRHWVNGKQHEWVENNVKQLFLICLVTRIRCFWKVTATFPCCHSPVFLRYIWGSCWSVTPAYDRFSQAETDKWFWRQVSLLLDHVSTYSDLDGRHGTAPLIKPWESNHLRGLGWIE